MKHCSIVLSWLVILFLHRCEDNSVTNDPTAEWESAWFPLKPKFKLKMRPLETNRRLMTWTCLHPPNAETSTVMISIYAVIAIVCNLLWLGCSVAESAFFWEYLFTDIAMALKPCWTIVISLMLICTFTVLLTSRQKVESAYDALAEIYKASK